VAEGVNEPIEVLLSGCLDPMEALLAIGIFGVDAIKKQHVKMNIEIERRTKALDQRHSTGLRGSLGETGLLD